MFSKVKLRTVYKFLVPSKISFQAAVSFSFQYLAVFAVVGFDPTSFFFSSTFSSSAK
jgi:hypothetical protein